MIEQLFIYIKEKGILITLVILFNRLRDYLFDIEYGTDTCSRIKLKELSFNSDNKSHGVDYQPTMANSLDRLLGMLSIPPDSVFVDFGSGKGRVLLIASLYNFKRVVGIEFSSELCAIAKKNIEIFKRKTAVECSIDIVEMDVVNYKIKDDENVFFFFNPFDNIIFEKLLKAIKTSVELHHRKIILIYYNPKHSELIEKYFVKSKEITIYGEDYYIYFSEE